MPEAGIPHVIALYSPARGSGVTTVAAHLFAAAPAVHSGTTVLVDCDIEFPTLRAFFPVTLLREDPVCVFLPELNRGHCNLCKACAKACAFGAISLIQSMSYIHVDPALCRACGACLNTCHHSAISEQSREIATWRSLQVDAHRIILEGEIRAEDFFYIKTLQASRKITYDERLRLVDARGGLDFNSLEAMHGADLLVLVIDLAVFSVDPYRQIIQFLQSLGKRLVVVVNRSAVIPDYFRQFCLEHSIPVAGCIPYDTGIPRMAAQGKLLEDHGLYQNILRNLLVHVDAKSQSLS